MTDQPRDENGRFVQIDKRKIRLRNAENTLGVVDDTALTPALEMVNVDISLLEQAISEAKEHSGIVRIGILRKHNEIDDKHEEKGIVCLKGNPYDDETVVFASLHRKWDESSERWQQRHGENDE